MILAVTVNGQRSETDVFFLRDADGRLYAPASFLKDWNLRSSALRIVSEGGTVYFDLAGIPGLGCTCDAVLGELAITAPAEAFNATRINIGAGTARRIAPYTPGGYLNYDVSLTHGPGGSASQALYDIVLFRGEGLFTSSFTMGSTGSARLMSTYQVDRIDAVKTLRIGDSTNSTGAWGRGVLFGGIQYGTNFAIRPDFVTVAMPSVSGKALLPSTVDVYVNHALRSRQQVDAGPFAIQNLPLITGKGEVEVVVRDLLGREQLITQPFFTSPELLREGLVEDSYELGWLRENYGLASHDYGDLFGALTYRKGLSTRLTAEARLELQKDLAAAGGSIATTLPALSSVLESSVALSRAQGLPPGIMGSASYGYLGRRWSANARLQLNSTSFRQVGSDVAHLPRQLGAVQVSAPVGGGTLSMNYLRRQNLGESLTRFLNVTYSTRLAEDVYASLMLLKPLSPDTGGTLGLTLTMVFDRKHAGSSTLTRRPDGTSLYTEFQKAVPRDEGTGYRLAALTGGAVAREEVSVARNQSFGSFQADLVRLDGEVSSRLGAQGGIAFLGGGVYFSRGLDEGFAVVQASEAPGVPVYLENQVAARTDKHGRAVIGYLRPYEGNRISIDPMSLPLEASVEEYEKIVVPRSQGGLLVDFRIRTVRSATLAITLADGSMLPPLTPVEVIGIQRAFISGNRGEVSVDLPARRGNRVIARPADAPPCELIVDLPDADSKVPFLGPLMCAAIR